MILSFFRDFREGKTGTEINHPRPMVPAPIPPRGTPCEEKEKEKEKEKKGEVRGRNRKGGKERKKEPFEGQRVIF